MEGKELLQGRWLKSEDVEWLGGWIEAHPQWSRKRVAQELCRHWDWRDGLGRLKDFAARSLLLKLEGQGRIALPALQIQKRRTPRRIQPLPDWKEPEVWVADLQALGPIELERLTPGSATARRWAFYLDRFRGTCYRAANWHHVGTTQGRSRQDRERRMRVSVKDVYLYRLASRGGA